jgi:Na+-driven multidrug efflux pump
MLVPRTVEALKQTGYGKLAIAGGVAANSRIRGDLQKEAEKLGAKLYMPPLKLCGDNGAMIGAQGYYEYLAGSRAGQELNAFATMPFTALQVAISTMAGQNMGAGQYHRVRKILLICLASVSVMGLAVGGSAYLLREPLLGIYIVDSPNAAVAIAAGAERMLYVCIPYFILGLMDVTTGVLRGLGSFLTPMIISVLGVCGFRIAWIYTVFASHHTPGTLFVSYPISWALTFVIQFAAFLWIYRKYVSSQNKQ